MILTIANMFFRRFMGGGVIPEEKFPLKLVRRFGTPIVAGLLAAFLFKNPWVFLIVGFTYMFKEWVGTGDMFAVLHGGFDGKIKYSIMNRWIYWAAAKVGGREPVVAPINPQLDTLTAQRNARWGFWFCTFRGLYKLSLSIGLGLLLGKWLLIPVGLLGLLDGVIYYCAGRVANLLKNKIGAVSIAEPVSGALFGFIQEVFL